MEIKEEQFKVSRNLNEKLVRKERGITLVALVITVVIMLILAGVAIAAVVDGDGLFSKTREATETYENAVQDENDTIKSLMNEIDIYLENPNNPVVKESAAIGTIMSENQTFDGRLQGTYNNPIIPKGFAAINENGADWGTEIGYQKGLVITDKITEGESTGNEFVWIPVDGTIVKFERVEWEKSSVKKDECIEVVPIEIERSVKENGGFYIARYEAGIENEEDINNWSGDIKPLSQKGKSVWNNIQWGNISDVENSKDGAVAVANNMYPKNDTYGVISTLIYGTQWDTTLKFIEAYNIGENGYNIYTKDSTGMGNYINTSGEDDIEGGPAECGAREAFRQKNIYDMAGNVWEWTMEICNDKVIRRGGGYYNYSGSERPVSYRYNDSVDNTINGLGFRVALYIK